MIHVFTRSLGWKLLSVLIAIMLWVAIAREPEVATSLSVPVDFKNMRDDLDISGPLPDRVRLELRGASGRLTRENLSAVAVVLDLSDAEPGDRTYTVRSRNLNLPSGVAFYRAVPSQLTLHFDGLVVKDEPVQAIFVNKPADYRIASQVSNPSTVRIRGAQDRVNAIGQIKTDPLDLSLVESEKVFHTHLNIGDPQVRLVDPAVDITVEVKMAKIVNPKPASGRNR
ncbi:MAG TPA: CdaR family protein [Bryobacteraceae bacterium]|nr:CdaR family protein [Bryobacteraceae bacterium]